MLLRAKTPKNIRVPTSGGGGERRTSFIMNLNLPLLFSAAAVLALSALLPSAEAKISVVNKAPRDGTIVKEGRPVRLSCRTSARDDQILLSFFGDSLFFSRKPKLLHRQLFLQQFFQQKSPLFRSFFWQKPKELSWCMVICW